jgi:hypothetical protein
LKGNLYPVEVSILLIGEVDCINSRILLGDYLFGILEDIHVSSTYSWIVTYLKKL